jgi:hypothetical protein
LALSLGIPKYRKTILVETDRLEENNKKISKEIERMRC